MKDIIRKILKEERLLGQTTRFYHKTCKKHLPSLMKGVRSDFNLDRDIGGGGFTIDIFQSGEASKSQGGGFYVSQDAEYIRDLDLPMSDCKLDTIIEIVAPLTTENFEIDYELFPNFCDVLIKLIDISDLNLYKFTPSKNGPIAVRVNKVNDVGHRGIVVMSKDDINEKILEPVGDWEGIKSNNKEVGFFTLGGCKDKKPNMSGLHKELESMNIFGIKDKLEETLFNNLPKKSALKYKGPTTKVTNYWININGKWVKNPKPRKNINPILGINESMDLGWLKDIEPVPMCDKKPNVGCVYFIVDGGPGRGDIDDKYQLRYLFKITDIYKEVDDWGVENEYVVMHNPSREDFDDLKIWRPNQSITDVDFDIPEDDEDADIKMDIAINLINQRYWRPWHLRGYY